MAYQPSANIKFQQNNTAAWDKAARVISKIEQLRGQIKGLQAIIPANTLSQVEYKKITEAIRLLSEVDERFIREYQLANAIKGDSRFTDV